MSVIEGKYPNATSTEVPGIRKALWGQDVLRGLPESPEERKATPITTGVLDYFPAALAEVARVSKAGNDQHNPGQPLHWARGKSTDHADCVVRHTIERGTRDSDGQRHSAKAAWRALALLQEELESEAGFMPGNRRVTGAFTSEELAAPMAVLPVVSREEVPHVVDIASLPVQKAEETLLRRITNQAAVVSGLRQWLAELEEKLKNTKQNGIQVFLTPDAVNLLKGGRDAQISVRRYSEEEIAYTLTMQD